MKLRELLLKKILLLCLSSIIITGSAFIWLNYKFLIDSELQSLELESDNITELISKWITEDRKVRTYGGDILHRDLNIASKNKVNILNSWDISFKLYSFRLNVSPTIERAFKGNKSYELVRQDGERYIVFVEPVEISGFNKTCVIEIKKNITIKLNNFRNQISILTIFLIVAIFIIIPLTYLMSTKLSDPITRLLKKIQEYLKNNSYDPDIDFEISEVNDLNININILVEEIKSKIDLLESDKKSRESFVHALNHELNTPITSLKGFSDLLLNSEYDPVIYQKCLENISKDSCRISKLNQDLQKLYLPVKNEDFTVFNIEELITECISSLQLEIEKKQLEVTIAIEELLIKGNRSLLYFSIKNIIHNSIKACSQRGEISINTGKENVTELIIKDSGVGIDSKDLIDINKPFYKGHNYSTDNYSPGLGLTITTEVLKYHNCSLETKSKKMIGTEQTINFTNILHSY